MSVFNKYRDFALKEKRAEDDKRKQEALKRLQKSQKEKELEPNPKLKELTDEEANQLQKELDMVKLPCYACNFFLYLSNCYLLIFNAVVFNLFNNVTHLMSYNISEPHQYLLFIKQILNNIYMYVYVNFLQSTD